MRKIYENSSPFDPGRFRYRLTFFQRVVTESPSGGQTETFGLITTFRAVRTVIPKRMNLFGSLALDAGSSDMYDAWDFIIRRRTNFVPAKDMLVTCGSDVYTIRTIKELDEPTNYWKLQLVKTDNPSDTAVNPVPGIFTGANPIHFVKGVTISPVTVLYAPLINPSYKLLNTDNQLIDTNTNVQDTGSTFIISGDKDANGFFVSNFEFTIKP